MMNTELQDATLDAIKLDKGRHKSVAEGMCVMEATAWLAGEKHSDGPLSACPVLGAYLRPLSDNATFSQRQDLLPFIPRLIGSTSKRYMNRRAQYLVRQAVTVFLPLMYKELQRPEIAAPLHKLPADATIRELYNAARSARQCIGAGRAGAANDEVIYAIKTVAASYSTVAAAAIGDVPLAADKALSAIATKKRRRSARQQLWQAALAALDGALAIGPAGPATLTPDMIERLSAYWARGSTDRNVCSRKAAVAKQKDDK
jgi:hypothetical protein